MQLWHNLSAIHMPCITSTSGYEERERREMTDGAEARDFSSRGYRLKKIRIQIQPVRKQLSSEGKL